MRFGETDLDHLRLIVPLIDSTRRVEPLIALQPDQLAAKGSGQDFGDLGFADTGLALKQQWTTHAERKKNRCGKRPVGHIGIAGEEGDGLVDGLGYAHGVNVEGRRPGVKARKADHLRRFCGDQASPAIHSS